MNSNIISIVPVSPPSVLAALHAYRSDAARSLDKEATYPCLAASWPDSPPDVEMYS